VQNAVDLTSSTQAEIIKSNHCAEIRDFPSLPHGRFGFICIKFFRTYFETQTGLTILLIFEVNDIARRGYIKIVRKKCQYIIEYDPPRPQAA
jgi:hypothetical protein